MGALAFLPLFAHNKRCIAPPSPYLPAAERRNRRERFSFKLILFICICTCTCTWNVLTIFVRQSFSGAMKYNVLYAHDISYLLQSFSGPAPAPFTALLFNSSRFFTAPPQQRTFFFFKKEKQSCSRVCALRPYVASCYSSHICISRRFFFPFFSFIMRHEHSKWVTVNLFFSKRTHTHVELFFSNTHSANTRRTERTGFGVLSDPFFFLFSFFFLGKDSLPD